MSGWQDKYAVDDWQKQLTVLPTVDETKFRAWLQQNKVPFNANAAATDYDMRGFYKAMRDGDMRAVRNDKTQHFPDTWKTPLHKSFSGESVYSKPNGPKWSHDEATGLWKLQDADGNVVFQEPNPKEVKK